MYRQPRCITVVLCAFLRRPVNHSFFGMHAAAFLFSFLFGGRGWRGPCLLCRCPPPTCTTFHVPLYSPTPMDDHPRVYVVRVPLHFGIPMDEGWAKFSFIFFFASVPGVYVESHARVGRAGRCRGRRCSYCTTAVAGPDRCWTPGRWVAWSAVVGGSSCGGYPTVAALPPWLFVGMDAICFGGGGLGGWLML